MSNLAYRDNKNAFSYLNTIYRFPYFSLLLFLGTYDITWKTTIIMLCLNLPTLWENCTWKKKKPRILSSHIALMTHCGYTNWFPFVIESYPVLSNSFGRSYLVRRNTEPCSLSLFRFHFIENVFFSSHNIYWLWFFLPLLLPVPPCFPSHPDPPLVVFLCFICFLFVCSFFLYHCVPILLISSLTLFALYSFVCDFFLF